MENTYKRTSKSPSPETRQKISNALKGKPKSQCTRARISSSLKDYWSNPRNFPDDNIKKIESGEIV